MKAKKVLATLMAVTMVTGMMTGCGNTNTTVTDNKENTTAETTATENKEAEAAAETTESDLAGTKITFLNSKGEIQEALENMAVSFQDETGIEVEIMACGTGEVPYTKITSAYNSGSAPTLAMLDTTDIVALAKEYAMDLSNEKWVAECDAYKLDGTVYSFPFCVEGRGLIYNKKAIEDTLGSDFDPTSINSYDALKTLLEDLKAAGMEKPVVISKEDWSLGAHQLGYIYDTYDGTTAGSEKIIADLESGAVKVEDYERFNDFIQTFDLLMEYNINGNDPLGALYDQDAIYLADGDAALWANGSWAWPNIAEAGASADDEYGFIPFVLGNDSTLFANTGMQACATKQVMIDNVQASEEQKAAAKEFLNWIVYSTTGQKMMVEDVAVVPACSNNVNEPLDPLGKDIQSKMKSGNVYSSSFVAPSDHWSELGASMQKYLAGQTDKAGLATEIDTYWTSQK